MGELCAYSVNFHYGIYYTGIVKWKNQICALWQRVIALSRSYTQYAHTLQQIECLFYKWIYGAFGLCQAVYHLKSDARVHVIPIFRSLTKCEAKDYTKKGLVIVLESQ